MRTSILLVLSLAYSSAVFAGEPTIISCKFDKLPTMIMIIRGGMGANNNTLQIGDHQPVELSMGSGLMMASFGMQEFVFSLRLPASVSISNAGSGGASMTYDGQCTSTLR